MHTDYWPFLDCILYVFLNVHINRDSLLHVPTIDCTLFYLVAAHYDNSTYQKYIDLLCIIRYHMVCYLSVRSVQSNWLKYTMKQKAPLRSIHFWQLHVRIRDINILIFLGKYNAKIVLLSISSRTITEIKLEKRKILLTSSNISKTDGTDADCEIKTMVNT
jgi:hypothetical protein